MPSDPPQEFQHWLSLISPGDPGLLAAPKTGLPARQAGMTYARKGWVSVTFHLWITHATVIPGFGETAYPPARRSVNEGGGSLLETDCVAPFELEVPCPELLL